MARKLGTKKVVSGLEDLQANVADMLTRVDGMELQSSLRGIAQSGARQLASAAEAQGWPKRAIKSIFVYGQLAPDYRRKRGPSALFGFRKRGRDRPYAPGYVEWNAGGSTSKRAKVAAGARMIGESLASMYEFGTSKMRARPAMRGVISQMRAAYPDQLRKILNDILAKRK